MSDPIIARATNPTQYDLDDVAWESTAGLEFPIRSFIWSYIKQFTSAWSGKKIIDIGTGSGWLLKEASKVGASKLMGIEPSKKNFDSAKNLHPKIEILHVNLQNVSLGYEFDVALSVLSLSHIDDLVLAFEKISTLLNSDGELIMVVPDFEYYKTPRFDYKIVVSEIDENSYAISLTSAYGTLADIVRKTAVYTEEAKKHYMEHIETIPMKPTADLLAKMPRFQPFANQPIFNLLRFRKQ